MVTTVLLLLGAAAPSTSKLTRARQKMYSEYLEWFRQKQSLIFFRNVFLYLQNVSLSQSPDNCQFVVVSLPFIEFFEISIPLDTYVDHLLGLKSITECSSLSVFLILSRCKNNYTLVPYWVPFWVWTSPSVLSNLSWANHPLGLNSLKPIK